MRVGILTLRFQISPCSSLKEKRSRIKPLVARLHQRFNLSVAETGLQDSWQAAEVTCVMVGTDAARIHASFQEILKWIEISRPDLQMITDEMEWI